MSTVYRLALRRARVRILLLALGFGLFELVVGLSYASVDQNAIRRLIEELPPALRALAGGADLASPTGYAGGGYLHPVALAVQAAAVISLAAAPAREWEDGVAEMILSRPIRPAAWLGAHALAATTGLAVVVVGGYLGGLLAAAAVDDLAPVDPLPLALACFAGMLMFLAIGAVALLATALTRSGGRSVGWATGVLLVAYAIDYLAEIWSLAEPLGPLSPFRYLDPPGALAAGALETADVLVLGLAALALGALALAAVGRRDLAG